MDAVGVADGCVADTVEQIEFPKPRDGKPVEVCVPLRFDVVP